MRGHSLYAVRDENGGWTLTLVDAWFIRMADRSWRQAQGPQKLCVPYDAQRETFDWPFDNSPAIADVMRTQAMARRARQLGWFENAPGGIRTRADGRLELPALGR